MSAVATNMIPVIILGVMVALTLIFLPHLHDDTPRRTDELPEESRENDTTSLHAHSSHLSSDSER